MNAKKKTIVDVMPIVLHAFVFFAFCFLGFYIPMFSLVFQRRVKSFTQLLFSARSALRNFKPEISYFSFMLTSVSVFCGSSSGSEKIYLEAAFAAGEHIAEKNLKLVYGGAKVGLMGAIADGALSKNGKVYGVLPHFMTRKEIAHENLTELVCVDSMHERKMKMHELSDAVIALPGGFGTMEELFEMLTWLQLGLHSKPIGVLNVNGFYDDLQSQVIKMFESCFLTEKHLKCILFDDNIETLLRRMDEWVNPITVRWISDEQT